ncbi:MAG: phage portal protein [Thermoplasmata archaeon]|nr:phage portal protein [Thermoplasmata archaeon]
MNGYLTQTEIINLGLFVNKVNLDTTKFKDLIDSDLGSELKKEAEQGVRYYDAKHDILNFVRYYNIDGIRQQYINKVNNKISHPFHKILVDQKVAYICGNPLTLSVSEDEQKETVEDAISEYLGSRFDECISEQIKGACNKGFETIHFYVDPDGELQYVIVPAEQIIPIYDTQYQNELLYVMRYYQVENITSKNNGVIENQKRYKVEWWDKTGVTYYIENESGKFGLDPSYTVNPAKHWQVAYQANDESEQEIVGSGSWGKVPFVILWNNEDEKNDLHPIKDLMDAFDKVKSGFCNDIEEFNKLLFVLKGFEGLKGEDVPGQTKLELFIKNFIEEGAIVVGEDGSVTPIKGDIPLEARKLFLELTKEEIFYFGQGVDVSQTKLGSDPSGVALKFMYSNLDMKANRLILKLKSMLDEFVWFIVEWVNNTKGMQLDSSIIDFVITKAQIFNEKEKVDMLNSCKESISQQTYLENLPFVADVAKELELLEGEKAEKEKKLEEEHTRAIELANVNKTVGINKTAEQGAVDGEVQ